VVEPFFSSEACLLLSCMAESHETKLLSEENDSAPPIEFFFAQVLYHTPPIFFSAFLTTYTPDSLSEDSVRY